MPRQITVYAVVKLYVEVDDTPELADDDNAIDLLTSNADYNFTLNADGLTIVDTEWTDTLTRHPN